MSSAMRCGACGCVAVCGLGREPTEEDLRVTRCLQCGSQETLSFWGPCDSLKEAVAHFAREEREGSS